jgi:hypothetical protein
MTKKKLHWRTKRKIETLKEMIIANDMLHEMIFPLATSNEPSAMVFSAADWCRIANALNTRRFELLGWLGEHDQAEVQAYWMADAIYQKIVPQLEAAQQEVEAA